MCDFYCLKEIDFPFLFFILVVFIDLLIANKETDNVHKAWAVKLSLRRSYILSDVFER